MDNWEEVEHYGIYDYSDIYTDEEIEEMRQRKYEETVSAPVSMESLGLSWRDFF